MNFWLLFEFVHAVPRANGHMAEAAALVFAEHPATMLIGLLTLVLAIQMISLGAISLQIKKYFEETYFQLVKLRRQVSAASSESPRPGSEKSDPGRRL